MKGENIMHKGQWQPCQSFLVAFQNMISSRGHAQIGLTLALTWQRPLHWNANWLSHWNNSLYALK